MIRVPAHARASLRIACAGVVGALLLAACGTVATVSIPTVTGVPSASISVPLSAVGCTTNGSCVAVGTSNTGVGPTSLGEYRLARGGWVTLAVPTALQSTYVVTSSCWNTGCLFGGEQPSGDALWLYDATQHTMTSVPGPTGGVTVAALSCYGSASCAMIDFVANDGPRFQTTLDGGTTWSTPVLLNLSPTDDIVSLACGSSLNCIVSTRTANGALSIYVTLDGGTTWTLRSSPSTASWESLSSLTCRSLTCLALAELQSGWRVVRTTTLGRTWSLKSSVASGENSSPSLACSTLARCVVGGSKDASTAWLAVYSSHTVTALRLRYVPSPVLAVACGRTICAGIAITTVMAMRS